MAEKDLFFKDYKNFIRERFIESGWVIAYCDEKKLKEIDQGLIYSALIAKDKITDALSKYDWDGEYGVNHAAVVTYTYIDYSSGTYAVLVDAHNPNRYHYPWDYGYSSTIHHPIHISDYLSDNK